ncbi:MAG: hypothetical protein ABSE18_00810 [Minisyncoccia bacterium]|jgi:hypothetical protein
MAIELKTFSCAFRPLSDEDASESDVDNNDEPEVDIEEAPEEETEDASKEEGHGGLDE